MNSPLNKNLNEGCPDPQIESLSSSLTIVCWTSDVSVWIVKVGGTTKGHIAHLATPRDSVECVPIV